MSDSPSAPLPVSGAVLSSDGRLAAEVREFNTSYGMDYFDDGQVRRMLVEQRAAYRRSTHGAPIWCVSLAGTTGLAWLIWAARTGQGAVAVVTAAALLALSALAFYAIYRQGVRKLRHPHLEGYRHVLAAAMAYGMRVTHVPDWLTGTGGGGVKAVPLPPHSSPNVTTHSAQAQPPRYESGDIAPLPAAPPAVAEYELLTQQGDWHHEAGWALLVAAGLGVTFAVTRDQPLAYVTLLCVPLAIGVWIAGHRLGRRKAVLETEALAYVRKLAAAQSSGAPLPELSPPLRKLLED
ncbi:hypothetical protein AB0C51_17690 [Streptomyces pathocidini]|uniref:hypothetical protein n=1 Tax=Streptomyces pathocidini TaxID=1650571 RepID=UPI00340D8313